MVTPLNENTIGKVFVDEMGQYWQHIVYCAQPTATIRSIEDRTVRKSGEVGSANLSGLTLLVPENERNEQASNDTN